MKNKITVKLKEAEKITANIKGGSRQVVGPRGLSAYEVWLQAGNTGAEADYLASLKGPSNTLSIGTVISGETASATLTGESPNQILNLVLPKGDDGFGGLNYEIVTHIPDKGEHNKLYIEKDQYSSKNYMVYVYDNHKWIKIATTQYRLNQEDVEWVANYVFDYLVNGNEVEY